VADRAYKPFESVISEKINLAYFVNLHTFRFGFVLEAGPDADPLRWLLQSLRNIRLAVGDGNIMVGFDIGAWIKELGFIKLSNSAQNTQGRDGGAGCIYRLITLACREESSCRRPWDFLGAL